MADPFLDYVRGFEHLLQQGSDLFEATVPAQTWPALPADAPVCMVFSPHPDDEVIAGALPLRLRSEDQWRVVNVAVTLGSRHDRRAARWRELERSCGYLGFDLVSAAGTPGAAFERVQPWDRWGDTAQRDIQVARVADLIRHFRPRVVVCPHVLDGHPAHIGTHDLVYAAVRQLAPDWHLHLLLSEYWNTQMRPALMVALAPAQLATLVAALSLHAGEVARNAYHLSLPAWCIDAARRGAERVGPSGGPATGILFASLYGWFCWRERALTPMRAQVLPVTAATAAIFA